MLVGGSPVRVLRLTPSGARQWPAGGPGRRFRTTPGPARWPAACSTPGSLIPCRARQPAGAWVPGDVTVVIPVRDRQAELARCLAGLAQMPRVIVVDDASGDPAAIARVAADAGARVLHRP